ncbi:MAG: cobalamin biosynthesis protein CbiD [Ruminococcaceae bacterium]|nr:cobalamin biosynthesis protein CbiD [Oscillospiraceae bacterium]
MDLTKNINGKLLRCGYTTGSCAAAAASAAARMLLTGAAVDSVTLETPAGVRLMLDILEPEPGRDFASCAVRKDSGDDPDVTNGVLVFARAERTASGITVDGGEGVGRVTKPGLDQPVGAAAINSTPRRMIADHVAQVCREQGYGGGIAITISIPGGRELAARTFNPRMGIEGGISVLGTSGIVEPMSNRALVDTVALELRQLAARGSDRVLLVPGNYGRDFAAERLRLRPDACVSCSNFIGDAIDAAVEHGFREILLIGHIGKLVKLGIGQTNTHSSAGDGRMETLAACAALCGAQAPLIREILDCATTDAALELLQREELKEPVCALLGRRIEATLRRRVPEGVEIGYVLFTNRQDLGGVLSRSGNAERMMEHWRE